MSFIPKPQEIYKHFKGNLYQITAVAEHTETGELLVIYHALYGELKTYARPLSMFTDRVDREKYPDVSQEFRFELQGPGADRQKEESDPAPSLRQVAKVIDKSSPAPSEDEEPPLRRQAQKAQEPTEGELTLDPMVLEFLDADEYGQRLNILTGLHHRITDDMITTMAFACDVQVEDGDLEERYEALKSCLATLERFECNRLR